MEAKYIPLSDRTQLKNIVWISNYVHKYYEKRLFQPFGLTVKILMHNLPTAFTMMGNKIRNIADKSFILARPNLNTEMHVRTI